MSTVTVTAKIECMEDVFAVLQGRLAADAVRTVTVTDAIVDTGTTGLVLPKRLIDDLGLIRFRPDGPYVAVRLTIHGRTCSTDVHATTDDRPVLIGRIPLHALDWVVDVEHHRLIGNPDHNGEDMIDAL